MLVSAKAFAPFAASLMIAAASQAQLMPTWETHIVLSQQDLDMIHHTVTNQIHGKPAGTMASWSNPASGNSGSVKLVKKLVHNSQQCEAIEYMCARAARRSIPSIIISPVACSRMGPGKSRELGRPEAL